MDRTSIRDNSSSTPFTAWRSCLKWSAGRRYCSKLICFRQALDPKLSKANQPELTRLTFELHRRTIIGVKLNLVIRYLWKFASTLIVYFTNNHEFSFKIYPGQSNIVIIVDISIHVQIHTYIQIWSKGTPYQVKKKITIFIGGRI